MPVDYGFGQRPDLSYKGPGFAQMLTPEGTGLRSSLPGKLRGCILWCTPVSPRSTGRLCSNWPRVSLCRTP